MYSNSNFSKILNILNVNQKFLIDIFYVQMFVQEKFFMKCLAIDIILRHSAAKSNLVIGNTIYPRPERYDNATYLGKGKDLWFGYHQSVRPCQWKAFTLNIDQHVSAFYRNEVFDEKVLRFRFIFLNIKKPF